MVSRLNVVGFGSGASVCEQTTIHDEWRNQDLRCTLPLGSDTEPTGILGAPKYANIKWWCGNG